MHYASAIPTLLAIVAMALLAFLVAHNQRKSTNQYFVAFVGVDCLWLLSVYAINFTSLGSNVHLGRFVFAVVTSLSMAIVAFLDALLGLHRGRLYRWWVYGCGSLLLLLTLSTSFVIKGVSVNVASSKLTPLPIYGKLYPLFVLYLLVTIGMFILTLAHRRSFIRHKVISVQQINSVTFGVVLFALSGLLTNLVLPTIVKSPWPSEFAPLGSAILAASLFYAISKHRLFEVHVFVLRAAAYLITLFGMTAIFVVPIILIFGHFLGFHPDWEELLIVAFCSVCLLYILQYFHRLFDDITSHIFFRYYYDPQEVLDELSEILVHSTDVATLCENTTTLLKATLRADTLRYVLASGKSESSTIAAAIEGYSTNKMPTVIDVEDVILDDSTHLRKLLKDNHAVLAVRLRTTQEVLGYILVGYKESGNAYDNKDKRLLGLAADEIAISLQNLLRFEEIQHFNETLQERIDKATGQLQRSNRRLKELDSTKDDFVSMASHQLRTPLTSVKGYLSMVLDGDAGEINETQRKMLQQSFNSSQQMVYLISDLLNLSRLKTGKFVIEAVPVDLGEVTQTEVDQLQEIAKSRGLTLEYHRPEHFPMLMLDDTKMRQVVMNLIDNALHYTSEGGKVLVALHETATSVEFTVKDTGIGVPRNVQHKLFTKFYRAENAQATRPDGTGLGLYMAKKVITAQDGVMLFESREGQGSIFGFRFNKAKLLAETH